MLTDLRTSDTITRAAIERIKTFDAAQRCAESGDRWRYVITNPLCNGIRHWAAQCYWRREDDSLFVRYEHRIDFDDIRRYAFTGTRDWRQWLEDSKFGQPQLTRRGWDGGLRRRGSLAWNDLGSCVR
jgi:hypothetical protein